jgi:hypothetical protein
MSLLGTPVKKIQTASTCGFSQDFEKDVPQTPVETGGLDSKARGLLAENSTPIELPPHLELNSPEA